MNPQKIDEAQLVFPANVVNTLIPSMQNIPAEFKNSRNPWVKFQCDWFYNGLPKGTKFIMKEGVDEREALRHLSAIQGSWEPKHEHKEAAVAYLASQWFDKVIAGDVTYESKAVA